MKIHTPFGGFLAIRSASDTIQETAHNLYATGADLFRPDSSQILLAAWKQFPGQGLWHSEQGAVAYDLDFTNRTDLLARIETPRNSDIEQGELLWQLYEKFGLEFLDALRGQFGFALWEKRSDTLIVATDPYGIRPVVYSNLSQGLIAGTRIRHLMHYPGLNREINPEAIYHYLFFEAIPTPYTIYKDVNKLEPGSALIAANEKVRQHIYYDIRYNPEDNGSEPYWRKRIFDEVDRAVARFVPLSDPETTGCYLSGGTDSSSISGLYTKHAGRPAKTFSIGFDDPYYNEMEYAHLAADHFGTEQHDYYVTPADVLELLRHLPVVYDEPFGNSSVVPAFFCARSARNAGVERLLGGDGGDEIFGGNERYVTNLVFELYHAIPAWARAVLEPTVQYLPDTSLLYKAKRYLRRANIPNPQRFYSYNLLFETSPQEIFQQEFLDHVDPDCFLRLAQSHFDRVQSAHITNRLLYLDMKFTITDNDLRKVTQMAEAAGIWPQYPFLNRDLVDFTTTIPPDLKVKWKKNRYIFKQAMADFLPRGIIDKKKHGMGLPVAPWFKKDQDLKTLLEDTLLFGTPKITRFIRPHFLQEMMRSFDEDTTSYYGSNLWIFLILELWLQEHEG
ncbi:MAG: asparagine synthase C-terminal domain-containing protein [Desulfohalobiaceae bacterium]|nr:asparagine synthase C-terminal domain-containing protein [Desulfohalobiaceae bacterium]